MGQLNMLEEAKTYTSKTFGTLGAAAESNDIWLQAVRVVLVAKNLWERVIGEELPIVAVLSSPERLEFSVSRIQKLEPSKEKLFLLQALECCSTLDNSIRFELIRRVKSTLNQSERNLTGLCSG